MDNNASKLLADVLDKEIMAMDSMLTALEAEHAALEARDPDALTRASAHKQACIDAVRAAGQERSNTVSDENAAKANNEIESRWRRLARLAHSCKEKNEINGMLIRWQQRYLEQTLAILNHSNAEPRLYGPDGASDRVSLHRSSRGIA